MANLNITTQEALNEVRVLIAELENLKKSTVNVNKANAQSFATLDSRLKSITDKIGLMGNKMNYLQAIINKNTTATNSNSASVNRNATANNSNANSKDKSSRAVDKDTKAKQKNEQQTKKNTKATSDFSKAVNNLMTTFGAFLGISMVIDIAKDIYENIKSFDALSFAIETITKTTIDYENSQKFLLTLTEKYGVELLSTANRWIKFLAAAKQSGLALRDTENIFRSVTKAASVLGLQTDELQSVYLALEQMLSKGKVTTEELRRQLGERLPGAMGIMAAAIGKTIPELDAMLKKGEVLSAEALPKFARALEQAYGIEHVENIKTLTAEQGRLTAAWETFIKNVSEGEGVIKKAIGGILGAMQRVVSGLDMLTRSDAQDIRAMAARFEEDKRLELESQKYIQALAEQGFDDEKALTDKISAARIALNKTRNEEEATIAENHLNELLLMQTKANDAKDKLLVEWGVNSVDTFEKLYQKQLDTYNRFQEEMSKPIVPRNLTLSGFENTPEPGVSYRDTGFTESVNEEELKNNLALMEAMYNLSRKFAETSRVKVLEDGEADKIRKTWLELKNLKEVYDLSKEIEIAIIQTSIDANKELIDSDKITGRERVRLFQETAYFKNRIAEIGYEIDLEKARIYRDKEIANLELYNTKVQKSDKYTTENKTKSAERTATQIQALNDEYFQKEILANQKKNDAIFDNDVETQDKLISNLAKVNARRLEIVKDPYNREIIEIKRVYEESNKTAKDRERLENGLKRVVLESANAQIQAKIAILRASIQVTAQSEEEIDAIIRKIKELEASIENFKPENEDDWQNFFLDILDYANQFNDALGDLVDATFERRIENINAEIEAERNKYDTLIALAQGDEIQQQTLRVNRERRIKELEAKRLKEEQKQARAKKAFALAGVAIDTAAAIVRLWVNPGFPAAIPLTVVVAALGAIQHAAILATPIPQYAEGGNVTKDEIAMINDANAQEYVKRGSSILTTDTKNAVVKLKRGDIVYKDYDDMNKNNRNVPKMYSSKAINENEFNKLLTTVSSGIKDGFKKASVNNSITIRNNDRSYRDSLSIWS